MFVEKWDLSKKFNKMWMNKLQVVAADDIECDCHYLQSCSLQATTIAAWQDNKCNLSTTAHSLSLSIISTRRNSSHPWFTSPRAYSLHSIFHFPSNKLRTQYAFKLNEASSMNFLLSLASSILNRFCGDVSTLVRSSSGFLLCNRRSCVVLEIVERSILCLLKLLAHIHAALKTWKWGLDYSRKNNCNNFTTSLNFKDAHNLLNGSCCGRVQRVSSTDSRFWPIKYFSTCRCREEKWKCSSFCSHLSTFSSWYFIHLLLLQHSCNSRQQIHKVI